MNQFNPILLALCLLLPAFAGCQSRGVTHQADVVVFGATPGGITAAIAASRQGASVILVEPTRHVGGMSTSGLNRDEAEHMARDETFGGLANVFFDEAAKRSGQNPKARAKVWQSHVAEQVFIEMLDEAGVALHYEQAVQSVDKQAATIVSLSTTTGDTFVGQVFIDASYEGDLLAGAEVSYVTGREARDAHGESLAGAVYPDEAIEVSPVDEEGQLLFGVMPGPPPKPGSVSLHPTPYNIRLNLTTRADNRVEITKPDPYHREQHELLARCIEAGLFKSVGQILGRYGMPGGKIECNNRQFSIVSMSIPGAQTPWANANPVEREQIYEQYRNYTHGLLWFLKTDPRVPQHMREDMSRYGLCKDEWTDNGHWPWQLYVREARRMVGSYVMTEHDITTNRVKDDAIHLGSHFIDSHQATRFATAEGGFVNEGRLWREGKIYQFPYRAITPKQEDCTNLLVPVCVSSTHVAFCSIRVEASWMMLGEAAGLAAAMALQNDLDVQAVDVRTLQQLIQDAGIPLALPAE
jgi:hypothetical protein